MELKINIKQELWESIEKNYENESYSSAILDAIHQLTETIRNKTGLEGDGSSLVGQAFGSDSPKIQLNKMQTESEKNVQKGMGELLRGVYTAIRNPRSHDKHIDNKSEADAIILFLDYLLKVIDNSKVQFEIESFLGRVFDKYYVCTDEYSKLLADEIPKRQRLNIAIEVVLRRKNETVDIHGLKSFMFSLLERLEENEIKQLYVVISEELKYTSEYEDLYTILHILPSEYWNLINKAIKIRVENILFQDVKSGTIDAKTGKCKEGALGTWMQMDLISRFANINDWTGMIIDKMKSGNEGEIAYVERYFWGDICIANRDEITFYLEWYIRDGLEEKDPIIIEKLMEEIKFDEDHPWWEEFEEELKEHPGIQHVELPF
ncbi:TIGR02391 family protein [Paenibacillus taichungensis]|uniref:TIGR02391 family protein n=1 Tax=Paenibacillus taichungensis TaxID=484184 RepID=A0ABX2MSQ1_9BACL|nr:TIGR02391 family protein [Paenibacillus taichungensis]NUU57065.1 TIGR02391 family protein [Paenibacillus taichungensis]